MSTWLNRGASGGLAGAFYEDSNVKRRDHAVVGTD